jgi:hypothetical protein
MAVGRDKTLHFSYGNTGNKNLKYGYLKIGLDGFAISTVTTVENWGSEEDETDTVETAIVVSEQDTPLVFYVDTSVKDIMMASQNGLTWTKERLHLANRMPFFLEAAQDQFSRTHLIWYEGDGEAGTLMYAFYDSGHWTKKIVATNAVSASLSVDRSGYPHISYYEFRQGALVYATLDPNAGSDRQGNISVDSAVAYPNPLRPAKYPGIDMTFANLPTDSKIKIFTTTGELVRELAVTPLGESPWNGKNASGQDVASGVYLAFIEGTGGNKTIKVAVQR